MISEALAAILGELPCPTVRFLHAVGPRNQPARRWLEGFAGQSLGDEPGHVDLLWSLERAQALRAGTPVTLLWPDPAAMLPSP
jgi:hypothetical protein